MTGLAPKDITLYVVEETVPGTINASPVFKAFRRTGGHAIDNIPYLQSAEVADDDQPVEQIADTATYQADIEFEATKQTFEYLPKAIQAVEETVLTLAETDIEANALGYVDAAGDGFAPVSVNDYIYVDGYDLAANNGWKRVTVKNGDDDIEVLPATAVEAAGDSVTFTCYKNVSASTVPKYTAQTRIVDLSKAGNIDYASYYSGVIDAFSMSIGESGLVTGSANFKFEKKVAGTAVIAGQTDAAADTSAKIHSSNHVKAFWIDGVRQDCVIKSMEFSFAQNFNADKAAACPGEEYTGGTKTLSGGLVSRLATSNSTVWRDRYQDGTNVALAFEILHTDGSNTLISIPRAKITAHAIPDTNGVISTSDMTYTAEITSATMFSDWT